MKKPTTIGAFDAKTKLSELLDRVESGEVITITRHGVPVARLEPYVAAVDQKKARQSLDGLAALRREFLARGRGMTAREIRDAIQDGRR
jgi:prevent-host-death family protein